MRLRGFRLVWMCVVVCGVFGCVPVGAFGLGGGRVYEMVSPVYKGGFGATHIEGVSSSGESVLFYSPGAFNGAPSGPELVDYVARRGVSGWSTTPIMVPAGLMPYVAERDVSPSLESTLALGKPGANEEGATDSSVEEGFLLHDTGLPDISKNWELAGGELLRALTGEVIFLKYEGASSDFCHILFSSVEPGKSVLLPEAETDSTVVYELDRGCGGEPVALRLVGVNNTIGSHGEPEALDKSCVKVDVGVQDYDTGAPSTFNAVADDGKEVFFTTCVGNGQSSAHQLFVRLNGSRTVEVSKPVEEACGEVPCLPGAGERASADFVGANEAGSDVYFTTAAPLDPATDKDNGNDLYMAKIGCPEGNPECGVGEREVTSLVQASHGPVAGEAAEVQGVVRLAPDGERAYFVARGVLSEAANVDGQVAVKGADNLYVYDSATEQVTFIADLCSGRELSGTMEDLRCPNANGSDASLWDSFGSGEEQTAGSGGEFLVFSTYAQLVSSDTDEARDVYRYDALTGALNRVSIGEAGYDANGNNSMYDASIAPGHWGGTRVQFQYELNNRAISEDGSRIVFTTTEPLSPAAINGLANVYEWHEGVGDGEGSVSLISSGTGEQPVEDAVISGAGRDVFFVTVQGLVPQDTDGAPDVYDARIGGGFPSAPAELRPCEGDACQGPLTNPAPLLVPGSVSQAPGGNFGPPAIKKSVKKAKTKKKAKAKAKKKGKKAKVGVRSRVSGRSTGIGRVSVGGGR